MVEDQLDKIVNSIYDALEGDEYFIIVFDKKHKMINILTTMPSEDILLETERTLEIYDREYSG